MPDWRDGRMVAQQSVFTMVGADDAPISRLLDDDAFEKDLQYVFPEGFLQIHENFRPNSQTKFLQRITIFGSWKRELLTRLQLMGISSASLFPGPDGLGEFNLRRLSMIVPLLDSLSGRSEPKVRFPMKSGHGFMQQSLIEPTITRS
jgi:hypothetical protein